MRTDAASVKAGAPEYYHPYLDKVPEGDILTLLEGQPEELRAFFTGIPDSKLRFAYAAGKWTPLEILGHLSDCERVFQYRVLRFVRGDETPLPGFDENHYVPAGHFNKRTLQDLLQEFAVVRQSSVALVKSLSDTDRDRSGIANGKRISVLALIWILLGHPRHHVEVIRARYL